MSPHDKLVGTVVLLTFLGVVFAITFGPPLVRYLRARKVLATGLPGTARIVEIVDTGSRYNNNPQVRIKLEVQPETGPSFSAELTTILSAVELQRIVPGATIKVRYDPDDRTRVAFAP